MHVVKLEAENVKRLKAVSITPEGNIVRINGKNGQGKTSVLDAITYALGGKDTHPPAVIRKGESHAVVVVDLGDIIVERKWTSNETSKLEVRSRDGAKFPSPQAMLDKLVGSLSFDPLSFMRLEPKRQAETLRRLVGVDFTELDRKRSFLFSSRHDVNADIKALSNRIAAIPEHPGAPADPVSVDALLEEQKAMGEVQSTNNAVRQMVGVKDRELTQARRTEADALRDVERAEAALREAQARHRAAVSMAVEASAGLEEARAKASALVDPDTAAVAQRIREAQVTNDQVRRNRERAELAAALELRRKSSEELTEKIDAIDIEKGSQLSAAKFPVGGLSFTPDGVTLNSLPLEQASAAEQLRVSLAMGIALNPKLKVLLIRDGSLLDDESLAIVARMADDAGAQVWIEMVGPGDTGVLIEDGEVKSVRRTPKNDETGTLL